MNSIALNFEGIIGRDKKDCAVGLVKMARHLDCPCKLDFNGCPMTAYPDSTVEDVVDAFDHLVEIYSRAFSK